MPTFTPPHPCRHPPLPCTPAGRSSPPPPLPAAARPRPPSSRGCWPRAAPSCGAPAAQMVERSRLKGHGGMVQAAAAVLLQRLLCGASRASGSGSGYEFRIAGIGRRRPVVQQCKQAQAQASKCKQASASKHRHRHRQASASKQVQAQA